MLVLYPTYGPLKTICFRKKYETRVLYTKKVVIVPEFDA